MRRLGQHFLRNKKILERIIKTLDWKDFKSVIEIGSGEGILTALVVEKLQKKTKVFLIEKDRRLAARLISQYEEQPVVEICEGDVLEVLPKLIKEQITLPYVVFGNIPYYITGKLFRVLGEITPSPKEILMMVQKEVGERVCAKPPQMNRLAASIQLWAEPQIVASISRKYFSPPPEVDSVVLRITPRPTPLLTPEKIDVLLKTVFQQPRKTVFNNLFAKTKKSNINPVLLDKYQALLGRRPQNLSIEEILLLQKTFLS